MPTLKIPTPLRSYINGQTEVPVSGTTVEQAMQSLMTQFPSLRPHLTNSAGQLRPFVNLFLGEDNIKDLKGLDTPLGPDDILHLIPSVAGG
ncbi:MAG: MoaD/ThiS family protein [Chloroflexi bacterium]|nr:MoaD/ThiS family protein [Chloroflexota bacterium]